MRIYVPTTIPGLIQARATGTLQGQVACAVTPAVREWYVDDDLEQLEFTALVDAAQACLALLAGEPQAPRRRVVVAADVPEAQIGTAQLNGTSPLAGLDPRSGVLLSVPVPLAAAVSLHLDEEGSIEIVGAAVEAFGAAQAGDDDAAFLVSEAEACDLLWYDISELDDLLP